MTRYNDLGEAEATCLHCGEVFYFDNAPGNRPMYCSAKCKQAAYRQRKRQATSKAAAGHRAALVDDIRVRLTEDDKIAVFVGGEMSLLLHVEAADLLATRLAKATALVTAEQLDF